MLQYNKWNICKHLLKQVLFFIPNFKEETMKSINYILETFIKMKNRNTLFNIIKAILQNKTTVFVLENIFLCIITSLGYYDPNYEHFYRIAFKIIIKSLQSIIDKYK